MLNNSYYIHIIRVPFFILCYRIKIVTVCHSAIYRNLFLYFLIFDKIVRFPNIHVPSIITQLLFKSFFQTRLAIRVSYIGTVNFRSFTFPSDAFRNEIFRQRNQFAGSFRDSTEDT